MSEAAPWHIWIDTGGTFTDCLARDPQGQLHRAKVLSTGALRGRIIERVDSHTLRIEQHWNAVDDAVVGIECALLDAREAIGWVEGFDAAHSLLRFEERIGRLPNGGCLELRSSLPAPILAARLVTRTPAGKPLPPIMMRLATTRGTNALLERKGSPTTLFITRGFGDLLLIGDQQRPEIFALRIIKPPPLYDAVVEVDERLSADGTILQPIDLNVAESHARQLFNQGVRSVAIAFMHSYRNPVHEKQLAEMLRQIGFTHVTCSSDVAPLIKILPRAQTAVADAYLGPVIGDYLLGVRHHLRTENSGLHVMTSAGGLVRADRYRACDSLLSGPAGGVAGAAAAGKRSGFDRIIGFDMGGTSTDVARFDGDFEYRFEHAVAGVKLLSPAINIETVAAGGGSICDCLGDELRVGPQSAGANPGPACYGAGGPLTLTDVNLLMGRLVAERFEIPLARGDADAAAVKVVECVQSCGHAKPHAAESLRDQLLDGFLEIANQRMAAAIEEVSIRQGYDPREYVLVAFGGAGGQHACAVAEKLGISRVVLPEDASLLSALGLGEAVVERFAQRQVLQTIESGERNLSSWIGALEDQARANVSAEGVPPEDIGIRRRIANLRLVGQEYSIPVENVSDVEALRAQFESRYRQIYGHAPDRAKAIEIESMSVVASAAAPAREKPRHGHVSALRRADDPVAPARFIRARFDGQWRDTPAFERNELPNGVTIHGPALVLEQRTTLVIESCWSASKDAAGAIVVVRNVGDVAATVIGNPLIELEVFTHRLTSIAAEMGQMLQRTAVSTNVKERLDFSCAVLDAAGELVVNAPHIPVHLGALGVCVREVRKVIDMHPGDVIITNHPAFGGSHLPDVTVITPVFIDDGTHIGYVANRAHHAEIGGTRPGSMPPDATTLAEEGVVISPRLLIRGGESCFAEIGQLLRESPFPTRALSDNLADLHAAVAANERGANGLRSIAQTLGVAKVQANMEAIKSRSAALMRSALESLPSARLEAMERLDDGSPLCVRIEKTAVGCTIDFTGSAPQHPGNFNATPAIVRSAVMYVLRLLIGKDVPLNEGIMRAAEITIPTGMLNPAFDADPCKCPAVVAGNTETSQRLVDTMIKALGLSACSQGTMNNILFGNDRFGYYETICGGQGAGANGDGAIAVHTHMTNTRITDPETFEHRYPVRLNRFAIRSGSGGSGRFKGGDGAVREMTFLEPMSLSIVSQHRVEQPFGMNGGQPGARGVQRLVHISGEIESLKGVDMREVEPGDRLIVETPGGGGWGRG